MYEYMYHLYLINLFVNLEKSHACLLQNNKLVLILQLVAWLESRVPILLIF